MADNITFNISSPKDVKEILHKFGLSPLKKFGQNFLCDENIVTKIANSANIHDNVLEIGAGLGALTKALCTQSKKVVCVEIDKGMIEVLKTTLADCNNVTVINKDILKVDLSALQSEYFDGQPFCVCANLPYYITSKIIMRLLETDAHITSICAMVQSEVADRLTSSAGDSTYGSITASCHYYTQPKLLFYVSKNCFYPAPDVKSAVIYMDTSSPSFDIPRKDYVRVVRAAFSMRRKTIYNNLKQLGENETVLKVLEMCNIDQKTRAEELNSKNFYNLAKNFRIIKE